MNNVKPILFNVEMNRAVREGRKVETRRLIKFRDGAPKEEEDGNWERMDDGSFGFHLKKYPTIYDYPIKPPCYPGDILYVRETWAEMPYGVVYRVDGEEPEGWDTDDRWQPSLFMKKEDARTFLKVVDVYPEQLQDMTAESAENEGIEATPPPVCREEVNYPKEYADWSEEKKADWAHSLATAKYIGWIEYVNELFAKFRKVWDSTLDKKVIATSGFDANPWVWVIKFEKCEKPAGWPEPGLIRNI